MKDSQGLRAAVAPVTALEALARHGQLVLLGDPGSGKSTFVNHLATLFARALVGEGADWRDLVGGRFDEPLFPVRIVLRRWGAGLEDGGERRPEKLIDGALAQLAPAVPLERWKERFRQPGTLVLFDGLDEVPAAEGADGDGRPADRRRLLVDAVEAFATAYPCRVLVTCRVRPYLEGDYQLADFPALELAHLDSERIQRFCHLWYQELARIGELPGGTPAQRRDRLLGALDQRRELAELARSPLLLTMLARVNARDQLPEGRAQLYEQCSEQLLWEWEKAKGEKGEMESLARLLEEPAAAVKRPDVERVLWELAYELHGGAEQGRAELTAGRLREALAAIHPVRHEAWGWADRVVALMRERGGLLNAVDAQRFAFPHRGFQEYLAARWLLEQEEAPMVARQRAVEEGWQEVVLLACGDLAKNRHNHLQGILHELTAGPAPRKLADWRRVLVAGQAWAEFGPHRAVGETGATLRKRIPRLLTHLLQHSRLPPAQRLAAGVALSDLGVLPRDLDAVVAIPADRLPYAFKVAKYPVTNAQYGRFVEDDGYQPDKPWWSEEARREIEKHWSRWPESPRVWGDHARRRPAFPVVAISWYEATAYCAWLTARWREEGRIGADEEVRLPTVAEWERAAGGLKGETYPWGEEPDHRRANTEESELGQPTPVHMYRSGASLEGVWDLAGNVWEWTGDQVEASSSAKVLVGGAWWSSISEIGAAARHRSLPDVGYGYLGFRVVVVPVSLSNSEF